MDELKMDGLELPDTGVSYDDLPDASEGLEEKQPEAPRPSDDMSIFSDMDMPVISEMDGSDVSSPAEKEEAKSSNISLKKDSPAFEEMGASASSGASSFNSNYSDRSGTYTSVNSSADSRSSQDSAPSYSGVYDNGSPQINQYTGAYNNFQQEQMELVAKGRKKAKIIGILAIVLDVLETLFLLNIKNIATTALRIYLIVKFMNGSNSSRIYTAVFSALRIVMNIISVVQVNSLSSGFAEYGLSIVITITQLILFIGIIANAAVIYFTLFDKSVKEFAVHK